MNKNNQLLSLAKLVEEAYEVWRIHPKNLEYKLLYERAKTRLDDEIKHCKETVFPKDLHH